MKLETDRVNRELREPTIEGNKFLASSALEKEIRRSSACSHAQAALPFLSGFEFGSENPAFLD